MLVLASQSPRRRELLSRLGIEFAVDAPDVDERCDLSPDRAVLAISERKARRGMALHPGQVILAADTLVAVDGQALGKPHSAEEACAMLRRLSGRTHQVYTGVTVAAADGRVFSALSTSDVTFHPLTERAIAAYVASGEPMDKAGAYALQGLAAQWIARVEGSPTGIIGLPLDEARRLLELAGLNID